MIIVCVRDIGVPTQQEERNSNVWIFIRRQQHSRNVLIVVVKKKSNCALIKKKCKNSVFSLPSLHYLWTVVSFLHAHASRRTSLNTTFSKFTMSST